MIKITPSHLHRTAACPGWLNLAVPVQPYESSGVANEGILAHKTLECMLKGDKCPPDATREMLSDATWAENIISFHAEDAFDLGSETVVDLGFIYPGMSGRVDARTYEADGTLNIFDYKYGRRPVEARGNLQMIAYALGLVHGNPMPDRIVLHILQPNTNLQHNFHVYRGKDFYMEWFPRIKAICDNAVKGTELNSGDHCRYCPKAYNCPALKADAVVPEIKLELMTPVEMCQALDEIKDIKELVNILQDSLEAVIISNINTGTPGLTYQLEPGQGRLSWNSPNIIDKLKKVEKALGVSLITEEPCTPTQALSKKVPKEIIDKLSERKPGKLSLKKIDFSALFSEQS